MLGQYGLTCDFLYQDAHYMVISREPALTEGEMNTLQTKMLQYNQVPRLLPIEFEQTDEYLRIRYHLRDKRMLSAALLTDSISCQQLYNLLFQLACAIEESKKFLLSSDQFILHEDYIFIGDNYSDIYTTYLPLAHIAGAAELHIQLKTLATRLLCHVKEISGSGVQHLLKFLNKEYFSVSDFKQAMMQIMLKPSDELPAELEQTIQTVERFVLPRYDLDTVRKPAAASLFLILILLIILTVNPSKALAFILS